MNSLVAEEEAIRRARQAQNLAIAEDNLTVVANFWTEDVTIRRGLGQSVTGKEGARKVMEFSGDPTQRIVYQRQPVAVEVSDNWLLAYEEGQWHGHLGSVSGSVVIRGRYAAQWVKRGEVWLIRSELFVALHCEGIGCDFVAVA